MGLHERRVRTRGHKNTWVCAAGIRTAEAENLRCDTLALRIRTRLLVLVFARPHAGPTARLSGPDVARRPSFAQLLH